MKQYDYMRATENRVLTASFVEYFEIYYFFLFTK